MMNVVFHTDDNLYLLGNSLGFKKDAVVFVMTSKEGVFFFQYNGNYLYPEENGVSWSNLPKPLLRDGDGDYVDVKNGYAFALFPQNKNPVFGSFNKYIRGGPGYKSNFNVYTLSQPEIDFLKNGFAIFQGSNNEIDIDLAKSELLKHKKSRVSKLLNLNPVFATFLQDPTLKILLDLVYPEGYHLTTYSSNTLRNSDSNKIFWHVDYPYHNIRDQYPQNILGVQVIYALNEFTVENGGTMYIPKSFQAGSFPTLEQINKHSHEIKTVVAPKGSVIIYRGDLWHTQGVNKTSEPRSALLANFSPLSVPAKDSISQEIEEGTTVNGIRNEGGKIRI